MGLMYASLMETYLTESFTFTELLFNPVEDSERTL